jgi:hypothetical protein
MKMFKTLLAGMLLLLCTTTKAQTTAADYFAGKWDVLLKGIPQGDTHLIFLLDKKDSTMTGVVQDTSGAQVAVIDKIELTETSITLYFTAQGYDVSLLLTKKDDDHVTGSLMNMFDAEGERVKVAK